MPLVFGAGADGWGVMSQLPNKGAEHTRNALEFAQYLGSPEVIAEFYMEKGVRVNPFPDTDAVLEIARAKGSVDDAILNDPWLSYLWDVYEKWLKTPHQFAGTGNWPQPDVCWDAGIAPVSIVAGVRYEGGVVVSEEFAFGVAVP